MLLEEYVSDQFKLRSVVDIYNIALNQIPVVYLSILGSLLLHLQVQLKLYDSHNFEIIILYKIIVLFINHMVVSIFKCGQDHQLLFIIFISFHFVKFNNYNYKFMYQTATQLQRVLQKYSRSTRIASNNKNVSDKKQHENKLNQFNGHIQTTRKYNQKNLANLNNDHRTIQKEKNQLYHKIELIQFYKRIDELNLYLEKEKQQNRKLQQELHGVYIEIQSVLKKNIQVQSDLKEQKNKNNLLILELQNYVKSNEENKKKYFEIQSLRLQQMKQFQFKLEEISLNRQSMLLNMQQKQQIIQQLKIKILSEEQKYIKLTGSYLQLEKKYNKQTKTAKQNQEIALDQQQKMIRQNINFDCENIHTKYKKQIQNLITEHKKVIQSYDKKQQLLMKQKQEHQNTFKLQQAKVNKIKEELNQMQHKYNQILNQKQKYTVDWIKDTESRIKNIENRKQLDYQTKILSIIEDMIHSKKNLNQNRLEIQKQISSLKHNTNEKNKVFMLLEEQNINLVKKYKQLWLEKESLLHKIQLLDDKNQKLDHTITKFQYQITNLKTKEEQLNKQIKLIKLQHQQTLKNHDKIKKDLQIVEKQRKQVQQKLKHQLIKKKQLEEQLKSKEAVSAQNILSLHKQLNEFRQSHNQLSQQNEDLKIKIQKQKKQLQRISTKLRHEYQLKLDNLSKQNILQKKQKDMTIQQKQKIYCKLKQIEREYELLTSEMVTMKNVINITAKVQKRYSKS